MIKLSVIYDSKTGNTETAANWIAEGMNEINGCDAKAFSIHSADEDFVKESKGVVIGSPSYAAAMTPDLHAWLLSSGRKIGFGVLQGLFHGLRAPVR